MESNNFAPERSDQSIALPFFIRGERYEGTDVQLSGRIESYSLSCPDPNKLFNQIILQDPHTLYRDFKGVTTEEIIHFLVAAGKALILERNPWLQAACSVSALFSNLTPSIIKACYRQIPEYFTEPILRSIVEFVSVYWKGGDQQFERRLITPYHLEKIIAWGGTNSIKHIKGLVGPGLDLITLDPKFSISIIGEEAFQSEETIKTVALLAVCDSAAFNQEACLSSRTHFVKASPEQAVCYAHYLYQYMQEPDQELSTLPKQFPLSLKENLDSLRYMEEFYDVVGGENDEGAVVTSLTGDPVDFFPSSKVVNVVPVETYAAILNYVSIATQSVGFYPESLKEQLADSLIAKGVQRLVSLGKSACTLPGVPHDALELMRRAGKWIVDEIDPATA